MLVPVPFFCHLQLFFSSISYRSASLFALFSATLCPRDLLFFHECVEHSVVRRDLYPLSFLFRVFPGVYGALSPAASHGLLPPGFRGSVPLSAFPLIIFSVITFFRTAIVFLTLDSLFLLWDEHEDDRDTLCMVPESKRDRGFRCYRSFITAFVFIIISIRGRGCDILSYLHPSNTLFTPHLLCVLCRTLATDVNMHDLIASMIALLISSWYFLDWWLSAGWAGAPPHFIAHTTH